MIGAALPRRFSAIWSNGIAGTARSYAPKEVPLGPGGAPLRIHGWSVRRLAAGCVRPAGSRARTTARNARPARDPCRRAYRPSREPRLQRLFLLPSHSAPARIRTCATQRVDPFPQHGVASTRHCTRCASDRRIFVAFPAIERRRIHQPVAPGFKEPAFQHDPIAATLDDALRGRSAIVGELVETRQHGALPASRLSGFPPPSPGHGARWATAATGEDVARQFTALGPGQIESSMDRPRPDDHAI